MNEKKKRGGSLNWTVISVAQKLGHTLFSCRCCEGLRKKISEACASFLRRPKSKVKQMLRINGIFRICKMSNGTISRIRQNHAMLHIGACNRFDDVRILCKKKERQPAN